MSQNYNWHLMLLLAVLLTFKVNYNETRFLKKNKSFVLTDTILC